MTDNIVNIYLKSLEDLVRSQVEKIYSHDIDFPKDTSEYYNELLQAEYLSLYEFEENRKEFSIETLGEIARIEASYAYPLPLSQSIITNYLASLVGGKTQIPLCLFDGKVTLINNKWEIVGKGLWYLAEQNHFKAQKLLVHTEIDDTLHVGFIPLVNIRLQSTKNIASEPTCTIAQQIIDIDFLPIEKISHQSFMTTMIFMKIYRLVGALQRALAYGQNYVLERVQFGKSLSNFQAIQHILATLAGEIATVVSSTNHLGILLSQDSKLKSSELLSHYASPTDRMSDINQLVNLNHVNAIMAIDNCVHGLHQVHGAIGFTMEYPLQRYTRRLLAWRADFTTPATLTQDLGNAFLQADSTWDEFVRVSDGICLTQ